MLELEEVFNEDNKIRIYKLMKDMANLANQKLSDLDKDTISVLYSSALITSLGMIGTLSFTDKKDYVEYANRLRHSLIVYWDTKEEDTDDNV